MRRIRGLSIAIMAVLLISAIGSLIMLASVGSMKDASEEFLANSRSDAAKDAFDEDLAAFSIGGLVSQLALVAILVLSIIWLYRIAANHRALGRATFWAPLWAIFGWLLPPFLFVIPLLILLEAWKAADPQAPPGSDTWKRGPQPVLVWVWFLLFGVANTAANFLTGSPFDQFSTDRVDVAERFVDHSGGIVTQSAIIVLSAIAWGLVVRSLSQRHTQLTGEAAAR